MRSEKIFTLGLRVSMVALMLAGSVSMVSLAQSYGGGFAGSPFGATRTLLSLQGRVLCADCTLEDVRQAQPRTRSLYQLTSQQGQVVMQITKVNHEDIFHAVAWPPRLWVRAAAPLLQQLRAEENWRKEMELRGFLSSTRTFDLATLTVRQ